MKIIIRTADKVVVFAGENIKLKADRTTGDGWVSFEYNDSNANIRTVAELPENWKGGVWKYKNDAFEIADQAAHDKIIAQKLNKDKDAKKAEIAAWKTANISNVWDDDNLNTQVEIMSALTAVKAQAKAWKQAVNAATIIEQVEAIVIP